MIEEVRGRRALVVGLGQSGLAAVEALVEAGADVVVTEPRPRSELGEAAGRTERLGAVVLAGGHARSHLDGAVVVVTSPGVPEHAPVLEWAREARIPVWSELELGARLVRCPYVAVTGTNGKTTTTEMVAASMRAAGLDAVACGNIGHPFSRAAREGRDALAVEASSFQLRFHQHLAPRVSVLLNLAPDHLDWHGSFEAYRDAKARIHSNQTADDVHVGSRDDAASAAVSREAPCAVRWFTLGPPGSDTTGFREGRLVVRHEGEHDLGSLPFEAPTLRADAAAAATAAVAFGLAPGAVGEALRAFRPLPHRGEVVAEHAAVRFVDDSKATNPHAALAAIAAHDRVVLIAGGLAKGVDLSPLAAAAPRLVAVVAMGEAAPQVERVFDGDVPVSRAGSIEEAVAVAAGLARAGDTVLLAPACASQDMFLDYAERGERFAAAARSLDGRFSHA